MIEAGAGTKKSDRFPWTRPVWWGLGLLVASGLCLASPLVLSRLDEHQRPLLLASVAVAGWLLSFSAIAFIVVDPRRGLRDGFLGGTIVVLFLMTMMSKRLATGDGMVTLIYGTFIGAALAVPSGWILRTIVSSFNRRPAPPSAELGDPGNPG